MEADIMQKTMKTMTDTSKDEELKLKLQLKDDMINEKNEQIQKLTEQTLLLSKELHDIKCDNEKCKHAEKEMEVNYEQLLKREQDKFDHDKLCGSKAH